MVKSPMFDKPAMKERDPNPGGERRNVRERPGTCAERAGTLVDSPRALRSRTFTHDLARSRTPLPGLYFGRPTETSPD